MVLNKAAMCHEIGAPLASKEVGRNAFESGGLEVTLDGAAIRHSNIGISNGAARGGSLPAVFECEAAKRVIAVEPNGTHPFPDRHSVRWGKSLCFQGLQKLKELIPTLWSLVPINQSETGADKRNVFVIDRSPA